jgi:RNA polymerase sigma-70 factor (ECF subfamily)
MKSDEARLLGRLQDGKAEAFAELLDWEGARVRALVLRMGVSPGDADDLTQEIWVAVFKGVASFRGDAQLSTWVYRLTINCCLKWREKQLRTPGQSHDDELELQAATDPHSLPPRELERRELGEQVRAAIDHLSDAQRAVVVLHEMHGLTYAQCAQALQVPVGTVKSRLFNAFGRLKTHLGPYVLSEEAEQPSPLRARPTKAQPCAGELP